MSATSPLLISIGNTRTRLAHVDAGHLQPSQVFATSDTTAIAQAARELAASGNHKAVLATVNSPAADALEAALSAAGIEPLRFGRDLPIPVATTLEDESTVGQDRLLDALGAFSRSSQACIVIDAGTAVTVDFVDGEGTFHGGAIAPGLSMMLRVLHEHTSALPLVELAPNRFPPMSADPTTPPFGKDTPGAIAIGVVSSVRGLVHLLIDRYAEFYEAYPRVIATGGDAPALFENDTLVEHIVPDLTLIGMLAAVERLRDMDNDALEDEPA